MNKFNDEYYWNNDESVYLIDFIDLHSSTPINQCRRYLQETHIHLSKSWKLKALSSIVI